MTRHAGIPKTSPAMTSILRFILTLSGLPNFFHDEKKIYPMNPEKTHRDVGDDRHDLPFQAVQKLFELALISGHAEIKAVDSIFRLHFRPPILLVVSALSSSAD
jgi:hypothetical protein